MLLLDNKWSFNRDPLNSNFKFVELQEKEEHNDEKYRDSDHRNLKENILHAKIV